MQKVIATYQEISDSPASAGARTGGIRGRWREISPAWAAPVVWLACLPIAFAAARLGPADPFRLRVAMIPIVIAVAGVVVAGLVSRRLPADLASGIGAGLSGGWVAFTLSSALHGTPYGFGGLGGDAGRLATMADTYSRTWHSSDGIVPSVPSNYPPLFPWLVGHVSALVDVPAWRLLGPAEAIALSLAVVAGYLLWRRLLPGPLALAATLPVLLCFALPDKAYEVLALAVFVPWAMATFGDPPRGRLHWLPAGLVGGLSILLYWAFIAFGALGVLALAAVTWRASADRARYARHLALTVGVGLVVVSWYLIPYLGWGLTHGSSQVEYQYQGGGIANSPLMFLSPTPLGVLELTGVIGLAWWRGRVWWGRPLLLLAGGTYAYWLLGLAAFVVDGRHLLLQDTPRLIGPTLAAAGILTIARAVPRLAARLSAGPASGSTVPASTVSASTVPAGVPGLALGVLLIWTAVTSWQAWMPGGPASNDGGFYQPAVSTTPNAATAAFAFPRPDGSYSPALPASLRQPWFPTGPIERDVASVLGAKAAPVTLTTSEELFPFVDWPGYIPVSKGAAGIDTDWPARYAALRKLSGVTAPAAFAAASARTAFGPIDVFILHRAGPGHWTWDAVGASDPAVVFAPGQFAASDFTVFTGLPGNLVLAVRKPRG